MSCHLRYSIVRNASESTRRRNRSVETTRSAFHCARPSNVHEARRGQSKVVLILQYDCNSRKSERLHRVAVRPPSGSCTLLEIILLTCSMKAPSNVQHLIDLSSTDKHIACIPPPLHTHTKHLSIPLRRNTAVFLPFYIHARNRNFLHTMPHTTAPPIRNTQTARLTRKRNNSYTS